jgi:myo-inositol-1(or 4)-monophosphatase
MKKDPVDEFLKTAVSAARRAADVILVNLGRLTTADIETKQAFDFVTKIDKWSEAVILETIRGKFPHHLFLSEETQRQESDGNYRWIIDPLDGTTNFIHSYPVFSISIALEYREEIIVAAVFDPVRDELFHAVKGGGSFLNSKRISVSDITILEKSLISTGFPFRKKEIIDLYLRLFREIFSGVSDIRRAGSAAIDLAYIAAGRIDGFFELNLGPWDIAAGSLLVREAGGVITDFSGGDEYLHTGNVIAGNKSIHNEMHKIINQVSGRVIER